MIACAHVCRVPLHKVFADGRVPPTRYKVLGPSGQPQGELSVALEFTPMVMRAFISFFVIVLAMCFDNYSFPVRISDFNMHDACR